MHRLGRISLRTRPDEQNIDHLAQSILLLPRYLQQHLPPQRLKALPLPPKHQQQPRINSRRPPLLPTTQQPARRADSGARRSAERVATRRINRYRGIAMIMLCVMLYISIL